MSSSASTAVDALFSKSLSTMVKGIRSLRDKQQSEYIVKCLNEIKKELRGSDADDKAEALKKLIYLQLLGYDMSWAAFHIIEVMSLTWIGHKRVGYLAAALCFNEKTDVSLLATNLFKKAFAQSFSGSSPEATEGVQYDIGAALSCFSSILTPALANDLLTDVITLTNSSRPYIRKKAVLALFKVFVKFPQALHLAFDRVTDKLGDDSPTVVSSVIYVLCELAARNPKNYLGLAPQFYQILTSSSNNWVLIKVVKLLGVLVPLEPRLAKKLQEPLCEIINTTPAKSLMYECVHTLLSGQISSKATVRLCLDRLREFIEAPDQNLKYLGLLGLHKLIQSFPRVVVEHKDLILSCLDDSDVTIRMRALDLVGHLVTQRNLPGVVRRLVEHLHASEGTYRDAVLARILAICAQDNFAFVADLDWYLMALLDLTRIPGASKVNALALKDQLLELVLRVPDLRPLATAQLCDLILDRRLLREVSPAASFLSPANMDAGKHGKSSTVANHNHMSEVLAAAAFCVGEYGQFAHSHVSVLSCLLLHPAVPALSPAVQAAIVLAAPKLLCAALQQPFFDTAEEAAAWEREQQDAVAAAQQRVAEIKAQSVLPPDVEDPFAVDDVNAEDEDEALRAAAAQVTTVGHAAYVGRTTVQHATFVERVFTVALTGLTRLSRSPHMEVCERATLAGLYMQWVARGMGEELKVHPSLLGEQEQEQEQPEDSASIEAVTEQEAADDAAAKLAEEAVKPKPKPAAAMVDLTDLLFGTDDANIDEFDPLAYLVPSTAPAAAPSSPAPASEASPADDGDVPTAAAARTVSPDFEGQLRGLPDMFAFLYSEPLVPVAAKAQRKVPVPAGLDLDAPIYDVEDDDDDERFFTDLTHPLFPIGVPTTQTNHAAAPMQAMSSAQADSDLFATEDQPLARETEEDREAARARLAARQREKQMDPFYLGGSGSKARSSTGAAEARDRSRAAEIELDMGDVGRAKAPKARMAVLDAGSDDDDDLFEGSALAVSNARAPRTDKKEKKEKKVKKDKKSKPAPAAAASPISAAVPLPPGMQLLHRDDKVAIHIQARPAPPASDAAPDATPALLLALTVDGLVDAPMLQLTLRRNKKARAVVPRVPQPSGQSQCVAEGGDAHVQVKGLTAGGRVVAYCGLEWDSASVSSASLSFPAVLKYVTREGPTEVETTASLPSASFVAPHRLTMAQFEAILTDPEGSCTEAAAATLHTDDVMRLLKGIETVLNVSLVEAANLSAGYYGRCATMPEGTDHVCVYAKCAGDKVTVNVKTGHEALSSKLVKDLVRALGDGEGL